MNQNIFIQLNGSKYNLESLLKIGAEGPVIEVRKDQINDLTNRAHVVTFGCEDKSVDSSLLISVENLVKESTVLFFKQDGKFTVIAGRKHVELKDGAIKGRLISTPMLKKARIGGTHTQPARPSYPQEFANRPRIVTRTPRKTYTAD